MANVISGLHLAKPEPNANPTQNPGTITLI